MLLDQLPRSANGSSAASGSEPLPECCSAAPLTPGTLPGRCMLLPGLVPDSVALSVSARGDKLSSGTASTASVKLACMSCCRRAAASALDAGRSPPLLPGCNRVHQQTIML